MDTYTFACQGISIPVNVYPAESVGKAAILYFHGGGLLYGRRDDLPSAYVEEITRHGYHLLCFDYLLAPESPIASIHESVYAGISWFLRSRENLFGVSCPYLLFGRSAGAYLILNAARRLCREGDAKPLALWPFYGYYSLTSPQFSAPSRYYRSMPPIPPEMIPSFQNSAPITSAALEERYFLYVYARQRALWLHMLGADGEDRFSVSEEELPTLPPAFLTASTADQDIPFSFSKKMSLLIPGSRLFQVFNLPHDYDRDPALPESQALYRACLDWTDARIAAGGLR